MQYKIKDVCQLLDLTVHSVRYYCDLGLVHSLKYDKNGNRLFDDEALNWLKGIKFLRASGMPISEIKKYFELCQKGSSTKNERKEILIKLLNKSQEELYILENRIECLKNKIESFSNDNDSTNPLNW